MSRPSQCHGASRCHGDAATGVAVVAPQGEIDLSSAPELRAAIDARIDQGARQLVVDLSQVNFIDSTGVRALLLARRRIDRAGGVLAVVCSDPNIRRVLDLLGVTEKLNVVSSRREAVRGSP